MSGPLRSGAASRRDLGVWYVLAASVLWGTTGAAATLAPAAGSVAIAAGAWTVGGLLLAAVAGRSILTHRAALIRQWLTIVIAAVAIAAFPLAFYTSMRLAGVAVGTVISIGSAPLVAAVVERVVDRRRLTVRWIVSAAAGIVGITALAFSRSAAETANRRTMLGIGLALLAGTLYAVYSWAAAKLIRTGIPSRPAVGAVFGTGAVLLTPVLVVSAGSLVHASHALVVVGYLAVGPMLAGYLLFGRGLLTATASTATTLSLLEPAVAALIAVVALHEHLTAGGIAGIALLLGSVAVLAVAPAPPASAKTSPA